MNYFSIKNFGRFQHYKKRNPPWIKLYLLLTDDYEFSRLQDASKLQLMLIWLLAAKHENRLPWDAAWVRERIGTRADVDLEVLKIAGFLVDASEVLANE